MQYIIATFDETKSCTIMQHVYDVKRLNQLYQINYYLISFCQIHAKTFYSYAYCAKLRLMHRHLSLVVLARVFALLGI